MNSELDSGVVALGWTAIAVIFMVSLAWAASSENRKHLEYLREHGCQVQSKIATGKETGVGKTLRREFVIVYECADSKRTELVYE